MAFEAAIFTDVTAAESVAGLDGFHFQSVSPGFTGEDMAAVQGELNFVPTPTWATAHDGDELSHPEQSSYAVRQGRFYFTRSVARGLTTNGRPGNQLTEAAATSSRDDLVPYSPAQLMTATAWTLAKAVGKTRDPWLTPLQIDPRFEDIELERFARSDPWVLSALPAFVTMLQRSLTEEGHRVFIQHRDAATVLRWIALGSMLLDAESATQLTFRVFTASPWNGSFKVVGVHPDLLALVPAASWQNVPSASWIDVEARAFGQIEPTPLAQSAVRWFVDHGIFEAMGAIQLAGQLQESLGDELAVRVAELFTFGGAAGRDSWELTCRAVSGLIASRETHLIESYADEVIDALTTFQPRDDHDFRQVAEVIGGLLDARLGDIAAGITAPTVEALAATPRGAGAFALRLSAAQGRMVWTDAESQAAAGRAWATALAGAQATELSALFTATTLLALDIDRSLLMPAVDRLAEQWAAHPALGAARAGWYAAELVEEAVAAVVSAALAAGDATQLRALSRGEWSALSVNSRSPMSGWVRAADLAARAPIERTRLLEAGTARGIPESSWRLVVDAQNGEPVRTLNAPLWAAFIRQIGLPQDLGIEVARRVRQGRESPELVQDADGFLRWSVLFDVLHELSTAGASISPAVADVVDEVHRARAGFVAARRSRTEVPNRALRDSARDAKLWAMEHPASTGELLVHAADRAGASATAELLGAVTGQTIDAFLTAYATKGHGEDGLRAALAAYAESEGALRDGLGAAARRFLTQHGDVKRALRRDSSMEPLIKDVTERYAERPPGILSQVNSWFGGKK